jgi:hypothetical protein
MERMRMVRRQGKGWMSVLRSGRQEPDRYCQGGMRRYPDSLASGPERSQQGGQRLRQRIDRSIVFQSFAKIDEWRHGDSQKRECPQHPFANGRPTCCPHPLRPWSIWRRAALSCPRNWILFAMAGRGGYLLCIVEKLVETGQING